MTVSDLAARLALTVFTMPDPDLPVKEGYAGDLLSWVMGRAAPGSAWLTIMSNQNVAAVAWMADVACVILTEGVRPDEELLARASETGINLLGAAGSTFATAARLSKLL